MSTEVTQVQDPRSPARTIYTIVGSSFDDVQGEAEKLMDPAAAAHFSIPFFDRKHRHWIAYGAVQVRDAA